MRNAEVLAREAVQEVAGDGFARGKANAVHKAVEFGPHLAQVGKHAGNLLVAGYIAVKHQLGIELGSELGDAVLEALTHVAESQLGTLFVAGLGNAIGDGTVGQHAGDEQFLAGQKTHVSSPSGMGWGPRA